MIKKSVFEEELVIGMQRELHSYEKKQGMQNLDKVADYLNSAIDIFEEIGMTARADQILKILNKIAQHNKDIVQIDSLGKKNQDRHTEGLTSEKMTKNLKQHGSVFNLVDDNSANDFFDKDYESSFEDED